MLPLAALLPPAGVPVMAAVDKTVEHSIEVRLHDFAKVTGRVLGREVAVLRSELRRGPPGGLATCACRSGKVRPGLLKLECSPHKRKWEILNI